MTGDLRDEITIDTLLETYGSIKNSIALLKRDLSDSFARDQIISYARDLRALERTLNILGVVSPEEALDIYEKKTPWQ